MNIIVLGCNGNIGKFISDSFAKNKENNVFGLDLDSYYKGSCEKVIYFQNNFIKYGLDEKLKKIINSSEKELCFINMITKDYPVTKSSKNSFLSSNSPFELNLDQICESYKITLGSSYLLIQELIKLKDKKRHLILMGSIYSRHLPNPENYSSKNNIFKPVAYSLSKSAQNILFKEACRSLSHSNFRINMVTLGGVYLDQNKEFVFKYSSKVPIKRMVNLSDIENCLNWIVFKSPNVVNGSEFLVDGGWSLAN